MKKISLFCLFLVLELLSAIPPYPPICERNDGNIEFSGAFRYNSSLVLVTKDGETLKLKDFQLKGNEFSFSGNVSDMGLLQWTFMDWKLMFGIDYPDKGDRVIVLSKDSGLSLSESNDNQLSAYLIDVSENVNENPIQIDGVECDSTDDIFNFCDLFAKLPTYNLDRDLMSVSFFPSPIEGLPNRVFLYFKDNGIIKRGVFVGQNTTVFNWTNDNSALTDLKDVVVIASTHLTEYKKDGNKYQFDMIEFFGTKFNVNRVLVTKDSVETKLLKNGTNGQIFGCFQSVTTKPIPTTATSTQETTGTKSTIGPTKESDRPSDESPRSEGTTDGRDPTTVTDGGVSTSSDETSSKTDESPEQPTGRPPIVTGPTTDSSVTQSQVSRSSTDSDRLSSSSGPHPYPSPTVTTTKGLTSNVLPLVIITSMVLAVIALVLLTIASLLMPRKSDPPPKKSPEAVKPKPSLEENMGSTQDSTRSELP